MNKLFKACALALGTLSAPALAQASASASANGSTTIIQPVTVTKNSDLVFGRIVRPSAGSDTVSISNTSDTVTATGGSAVYSAAAIQHLKQFGPIIFLDVALEELAQRFSDMNSRGVARAPEQTFADVYAERRPLYLQHADIIIHCDNKKPEALIEEIICQQGQNYAATQDA